MLEVAVVLPAGARVAISHFLDELRGPDSTGWYRRWRASATTYDPAAVAEDAMIDRFLAVALPD
jgi:hypothetical protein